MKIWVEFAGVDGALALRREGGAELLPFGSAFANVRYAKVRVQKRTAYAPTVNCGGDRMLFQRCPFLKGQRGACERSQWEVGTVAAADVKSPSVLSRRHYQSAIFSRDWRLLATLVARMTGRGVLIVSSPNKT